MASYHWGYTTFSDIPIYLIRSFMQWQAMTLTRLTRTSILGCYPETNSAPSVQLGLCRFNAKATIWFHRTCQSSAMRGCGVGWDWFDYWKLPWDIISGYHGYHQLHHQLDNSMDNSMDNIKIVEIVKQDLGNPLRLTDLRHLHRLGALWAKLSHMQVTIRLTRRRMRADSAGGPWEWDPARGGNFETLRLVVGKGLGLGWVLFHQKNWLDAMLS